MDVDPPARRRRRWPYLAASAAAVAAAILGVAGGAARATTAASSDAARLQGQGSYAAAIALFNQVAARRGPLYLLARGDASAAPVRAQQAQLAWAIFLGRHGNTDEADALIASLTDPSVRRQAAAPRASLLLAAAQASAARGDYAKALGRLDQVRALGASPAVLATVAQLTPQYQVGLAQAESAAGHGSDAVALLDAVRVESAAAASSAQQVLPQALLAAGREDIAMYSLKEAAGFLQRLESDFPGTPEASQAASLLSAGQPVIGSLVDRSGSPLKEEVRLSSHFYSVSGGYYTTGPFFYGSSNSLGVFRFDSIPVGGPYVLEVFRGGGWVTFVDPGTGQPANPVTVSPLVPVDMTFIALP